MAELGEPRGRREPTEPATDHHHPCHARTLGRGDPVTAQGPLRGYSTSIVGAPVSSASSAWVVENTAAG